ncbi:glutamate carboxypeptidase 2-like isoform X2 [Actinia tenebrosa]|uniref:Glutamate carboxypeptidase 2-like isoform X2 n=1 Tax=Actinia tenebrosa TaxID=6105 RepID=A0A6P8HZM1_ACTTE|nr:glutamate carboxypeptidase 2-like isoform X2 [Actinia tenebrosa]
MIHIFHHHNVTGDYLIIHLQVVTTKHATPNHYITGKTKPPIIRTTEQYHQTFNNMTSKSELENNLRFFSSIPHMETSIGNENITNHIRDTWKSYGFEVEEPEYEVLMSLPQEDNPNKVSIINDDTKEVDYEIVGQLNVTAGGLQGNDVFKYKPFLAYSPNGTVEGELVYANLGSEKDFQELEKRNISVKGKIVMFKDLFGEVRNAKLRGAVGAIVYPDPITHALEGIQPGNTYPQKPWMPPNGVQSKSLSNILGDNKTPLLPSKRGMYRRPLNQTMLSDLIPAQSISYEDASILLRVE